MSGRPPRTDGDRRSAIRDRAQPARFLIVGSGRSGSSLLAAVLAAAGADFGLRHRERWDAREGALEHPALDRAWRWRLWAERLRTSPVPDALGRRPALRRADRALAGALQQARFLKSTHLVHMVGPVAGLGYAPRIIISYRDFPGYARSRYRKHGWSWAHLEAAYVDSYRTALLAHGRHGGCAVDYAELIDERETAWAHRLAACTGLDPAALLDARDRIADPGTDSSADPSAEASVDPGAEASVDPGADGLAPAPHGLSSAETDAVYRALRGL